MKSRTFAYTLYNFFERLRVKHNNKPCRIKYYIFKFFGTFRTPNFSNHSLLINSLSFILSHWGFFICTYLLYSFCILVLCYMTAFAYISLQIAAQNFALFEVCVRCQLNYILCNWVIIMLSPSCHFTLAGIMSPNGFSFFNFMYLCCWSRVVNEPFERNMLTVIQPQVPPCFFDFNGLASISTFNLLLLRSCCVNYKHNWLCWIYA